MKKNFFQFYFDSKVLDKMDIIIGPLYARNFNILCRKYGNNKEKIIINPLSNITKSVEEYKSVYHISPRVRDQSVLIKNRITNKYKNKRVILFSFTGAFTPVCSEKQIPSFEKNYNKIQLNFG